MIKHMPKPCFNSSFIFHFVGSGLAIAGDPHFKTFEAAYPFVIQKLLTENSVATRKILHSVLNSFKTLVNRRLISYFIVLLYSW